jgi:uncharacterized damage-inducible protein DinB
MDREFDFTFPETVYPEILIRLRTAPARLEALIAALPREVLIRRDGERWSIQEHAGHLMDVDSLFIGRLDDYLNGEATLRPADVTGRRTYEANHNEADLKTILDGFRKQREAFVARLDGLSPTDFGRSAMHPRLQKPMRLCDMLFFQAEHDDHHLTTIRELIDR